MPEWQVVLISAGAAILSSALTAYISHRLERNFYPSAAG